MVNKLDYYIEVMVKLSWVFVIKCFEKRGGNKMKNSVK